MQGIDTSVLVRYLVADHPEQKDQAASFLYRCTKEQPCFINRIVLCELVWILECVYYYPRSMIAQVIEKILRTAQFKVEDLPSAWHALAAYRNGEDFTDSLISQINRAAGCRSTFRIEKQHENSGAGQTSCRL